MIVDDEQMILDLAREILRRFGYSVLTASDGEEAVRLYRDQSREIALVVLDMVMPGLDGRAVFRRLLEINPAVKVIILSGYSHDRDAADLVQQGASGFVQKPYRVAELVKVVGEVVQGKNDA